MGGADMTETKREKAGTAAKGLDPASNLNVKCPVGKTKERALADVGLDPIAAAMSTAHRFNKGTFGDVSLTDTFDSLSDKVAAFEKGDHSQQRAMLIGQSLALNAIFTELARRAALNMGEYINASERYMRLALKAQAQSRATVEALDRLTNGREQTVRHVHVDNRGGQAVIAETVQTGGQENGKSNGQPHALESVTPSGVAPMWGENPEREAVYIASDAKRAV
jgi:hypothetical protein